MGSGAGAAPHGQALLPELIAPSVSATPETLPRPDRSSREDNIR